MFLDSVISDIRAGRPSDISHRELDLDLSPAVWLRLSSHSCIQSYFVCWWMVKQDIYILIERISSAWAVHHPNCVGLQQ